MPAFCAYARRPRTHFAYRQIDLNEDTDAAAVTLDEFAPEYIVNYAAQGDDAASWTHPADFFRTNDVALARLADRLKSNPGLARFLQVSSAGVYGGSPGPHTEQSSLQPGSPYSVSKAAADLLLLAYHKHCGFPAQIVRPPNLYGPYQQLYRIIPKAVILLKRGERVELHGGGRVVRAYLHVRDASRAMLAVLESGGIGEIYNVTPDDSYAIREIVAMVCDAMGKDFRGSTRDVADRPGQESRIDIESVKIRGELGWRPQIPIREGIAAIRDWIERYWEQLSGEPLEYAHRR